jgi:hypothetical protein
MEPGQFLMLQDQWRAETGRGEFFLWDLAAAREFYCWLRTHSDDPLARRLLSECSGHCEDN